MSKSQLRKTMRVVHYWTSLAVLLAGGLVAATGVLLLLKKDMDWLQPTSAVASQMGASDARIDALFDAASAAAPKALKWDEIDRIDVRPSDGLAKVITKQNAEYQVDMHTLDVISKGHRGADIVEKIHDGTFFSRGVKYFVMLPSGIALFALWITGIYLFLLPRLQKRRRKPSPAARR